MKSLTMITKTVFATALLVFMLVSYAKPPTATTTRPIEDFVDRQGTFCWDVNFQNGGYQDVIVDGNFVGNCDNGAPPILFVPPIANFLGTSDPQQGRLGSIDYAGLADYWSGGAFGTTFSGTVIERPLRDGRAHVKVVLRTQNALTLVVTEDYVEEFLLFGNFAPAVLDGAEAALGTASLVFDFINTAPGDPLPDLIQLFVFPEPGQEVLDFRYNNKANGPLTELFGVPEGTPGLTTGTQAALLSNPNCGNPDSPSAVTDCFPVEIINLRAVGQ